MSPMKKNTFEEAQQLTLQAFTEKEEDFYKDQDLHQNFKTKKFKIQNVLMTRKIVTERVDMKILLQVLKNYKIGLSSEDQKLYFLENLAIQDKLDFIATLSKYDTLIWCDFMYIWTSLGVKILPNFQFSTLSSILIDSVPFSSFEGFSWINAPFLQEIRVLKSQVTRIKGLNKVNFPHLMFMHLVLNHISDYERISRIHFNKQNSASDIRLVSRIAFLSDYEQVPDAQEDDFYYNNMQVFVDMDKINSLNFIVKIQSCDVDTTLALIVMRHITFLRQFYKVNLFPRQQISYEDYRKLLRKRPLVESGISSFAKRFDSKNYDFDQLITMIKTTVSNYVERQYGPLDNLI